jgi:ADP-ribose pyrophosphatase YjhB (NUDIX family)
MTVSGFVVHEGKVALHWHRKINAWLPAGGHIEANEDPVQAVMREIDEEFAVKVGILPPANHVDYEGGPAQLTPPHAMIDCWAVDHWHVDLVYYCRLLSGYPGRSYEAGSPIFWLNAGDLNKGSIELKSQPVPIPPDVQAFGLEAIRQAHTYEASLSTAKAAS